MTPSPDSDYVVVRVKHGNPSTVFVLGTSLTPDQFIVGTRDEAVSQAIAGGDPILSISGGFPRVSG